MDFLGIGSILTPIVDVLKGTGILKDTAQEAELKKALAQAEIEYEKAMTSRIEAVNATMQAEAKSEHWAQWLWRPLIGFTFSGVILNNFVLMPYFFKFGLQPVAIPDGIWTAMLVVLGVSAGTRGWAQVEAAKRNGNGH